MDLISLTLTIITSTVVKISRISRLTEVCKKNSYDFAPPDIEPIYVVEKHSILIAVNCVVAMAGIMKS